MKKKPDFAAIGAKIAAGGVLDFRSEYCPWIGVSPVKGYELIRDEKVKTFKMGRGRKVTAANAIESRDNFAS